MPLSSYECLFLLDPTKTATDADAVKGTLHASLEKHGAEILVSRKWDERKLAYPIAGQKKGVYHLAYFKADSLKIKDLELDFRLNEAILRHMVSAIDPKWHDEMLAVAQDDHRFALQLMQDESPEGGGGGGDRPPGAPPGEGGPAEGGDDRSRRPRNPEAEHGKV